MNKQQKISILVLLILTVITGTLSIIMRPDYPSGDSRGYEYMALSITSGNGFPSSNGNINKPGYPFFLATVYSIFGERNHAAVYVLQFFMLFLISAVIFQIGLKHFRFQAYQAIIPSILIIVWPYFVLYSILLLTEILYTFFLVLCIYYILESINNQSKKNLSLSALFLALAVLTRPVPLLLPFWLTGTVLLMIIYKKNYDLKKFFKSSALAIMLFLIFLGPWVTYASYKTGKFTPVTSNGSHIFEVANKDFSKEFNIYNTPGYEKGGEWTIGKLVKAKLKNVYRFWKSGAEGYHVDRLVKKYPFTKYLILLYRIGFYAIVALGLSSIYLINKKKEIFFFWLIIAYFWAVHVALFPYPRFTLPIIPIVIVLAFYNSIQIFKYLKKYFQIN